MASPAIISGFGVIAHQITGIDFPRAGAEHPNNDFFILTREG